MSLENSNNLILDVMGARVDKWIVSEDRHHTTNGLVRKYVSRVLQVLLDGGLDKVTASSWMLGMNSDLDDRNPIEMCIRSARTSNPYIAEEVYNAAVGWLAS